MPFTRPDIDTIYQRLKTDLEQRLGHTNWLSRSVLLAMLAVYAGSIHLAYGALVQLSKELFFTTSVKFLDWWAELWGLPRKDAVKATTGPNGYRFTGIDTTAIPQYTAVQTPDGTVFLTDTAVVIAGGEALVGLTARVKGSAGNVEATTMELVSPIAGVDTEGTVLIQPTGGTDRETDDELKFRLLQRTRNPPGSGNVGDYVRWALEVTGVGRAWAFGGSDWFGAGTVGVVIASSDLSIVDAQVKTDVIDYIEARRPVGADVSIEDPIPRAIGFDLSITPNTASIQAAILEQLNLIFLLDSSPGGTMLLSHINKSIASTAVVDFEITELRKDGTPISIDNITTSGLELSRLDEGDVVFATLT